MRAEQFPTSEDSLCLGANQHLVCIEREWNYLSPSISLKILGGRIGKQSVTRVSVTTFFAVDTGIGSERSVAGHTITSSYSSIRSTGCMTTAYRAPELILGTIMLRAGLTGGLGSGKSTVAAMFRSLGAHVIEADAIGRELMSPGQDVYRSIVSHFGPDVASADGTLDRRRLAEIAFRQNRFLELNRIVHPAVIAAQRERAERIFAEFPNAVIIVESALIFEADAQNTAPGWKQRFDRLILVTVPDEIKIARYLARMASNSTSQNDLEADARARLAAQIPDTEKIPLCDYVIRNDGSIEETQEQVRRIFAELAAVARV